MEKVILYLGYGLIILGLLVLMSMAYSAYKLNSADIETRKSKAQQFIIMNFAGLGLAFIGLMLLVISKAFY